MVYCYAISNLIYCITNFAQHGMETCMACNTHTHTHTHTHTQHTHTNTHTHGSFVFLLFNGFTLIVSRTIVENKK